MPVTNDQSTSKASNEIGSICARLLDSEEFTSCAAIPQVAEDAAALLKRLSADLVQLEGRLAQLQSSQSRCISPFALVHGGRGSYVADASRTGEAGIYEELRIGIFKGDGKECVGDVLVGLNESGEPRVLITASAEGEECHQIAVFPLRPATEAVEPFKN